MLDRIRWAITRFYVKYGIDWDKDHADRLAAIKALAKEQPTESAASLTEPKT